MSESHRIETVKLELVRPGPAHGQLLSPLTQYLALCGEEPPVTLTIGLEHWRVLNRLERLRYWRSNVEGKRVQTPEASREAELAELGRDMGNFFGAIPTLGGELKRAMGTMGADSRIVHLRLVLSGSELALLPYELLISPPGYPDEGSLLLLQPNPRVVITRETRKGRDQTPLDWRRKPKILFVSAGPGHMTVPHKGHLQVLRKVLEPWIEWEDDQEERLTHVHEHMTVIENASIEKIRDACARDEYTHVHILAHGGEYKDSGERRFGLVLCDHLSSKHAHIVDGKTIAEALTVQLAQVEGRSSPIVVSLATCDAGNVGSVTAPGSSIAYDLHTQGIPWVFASQFPLTMLGSISLTEQLYEGLLWGEDPRYLLERLRQSLYIARKKDHDWASLVAYTSTPDDLFSEVEMFRSYQYQRAISNDLRRADHHQEMDSGTEDQTREADFDAALQSARSRARQWREKLPKGDGPEVRKIRCECYGVSGATEKKIAKQHSKARQLVKANDALEASRSWYRDALREKSDEHWPATQYLALCAILDRGLEPDRWTSTYVIAKAETETAKGEELAWAYGTLAELEMLRAYHLRDSKAGDKILESVCEHCANLVETVGWDDFAVASTRDQFQRYVDDWWRHDRWSEIAEAAVATLTRDDPDQPSSTKTISR